VHPYSKYLIEKLIYQFGIKRCYIVDALQVSLKYPIGTSKMGAPRHDNERAEGERKLTVARVAKPGVRGRRPTRQHDV